MQEDMWKCGDHVKLISDAIVPTYENRSRQTGYYMVLHQQGRTYKNKTKMWQNTVQQLLKCRAVCKEWRTVITAVISEHMWAFKMYVPRNLYQGLWLLRHFQQLKQIKRIKAQ